MKQQQKILSGSKKVATEATEVKKTSIAPIVGQQQESVRVAPVKNVSSGHQETTDSWVTVQSKKKKKKLAQSNVENSVEDVNRLMNGVTIGKDKAAAKKAKKAAGKQQPTNAAKNQSSAPTQAKKAAPVQKNQSTDDDEVTTDANANQTTDPFKRLRNLRKKLKEIDSLRSKDRKTLEKDQLEKLNRYQEVKQQIQELSSEIE